MKLEVIGLRGFPMVEGGVEKHCEQLYPRLSDDIDIKVYRRRAYVNNSKQYDRITFVDLPSTKMKGIEPLIHSFIASVCALISNPDVVHYHNIGPALFSPIVKLRNIRVVLTYHSPNYEHQQWGYFAKKVLLLSEKVSLKIADKVIFVNKFQMEKFNNINDKALYIPNGVCDLKVSNNIDYLYKIGVSSGEYIISVGRIIYEKGFDVLIKAFIKANTDLKLVIVGGSFDKKLMDNLRALSSGHNIIFTGFITGDDLYQLYANARLFVLASRNEGFPLVLLEAMKFNLDILVSDIPAMHMVDLDESDYFECDNVNQLACRISDKINNNIKRTYDLSDYDWNMIANKMSSIYHEVGDYHD